MNLNQFFEKTYKVEERYNYQEIRPQITCKDGIHLSVQASDGHYCSPRRNGTGPYFEVEVGYPSIRPPKTWYKYFDGELQTLGLFGSLKRLWENRSMIFYTLKQKPFSKRMLKHYLSFQDNATDSVYGYIPSILVEDFINKHGGIDEKKTFKD